MSYKQVDMINLDEHLKDLEFYTEYLKWEGNDLQKLTGPTSTRQQAKRKLFSSEQEQPNKRIRIDKQDTFKLNIGKLILKSKHTVQQIINRKIIEYERNMKETDNICISRLSWANISRMEVLGEGAWGKVSKALYSEFNKVAVKTLDEDIEWNSPEERGDMIVQESIALKALECVQGVPQLFGLTVEEPLALVMSYHKGENMFALVHKGDVHDMLDAFIKICKTVRKMHRLGWAHNDLHLNNVVVHHSCKNNKLQVTVVDYGLCRELSSNPHWGIYHDANDLPPHLPVDVTKDGYEGDLIDRFSLCKIAVYMAQYMTTSPSIKEFLDVAEQGCTTLCPDDRPSPRTMSRLASAALETFQQNMSQ